MKSFIDHHIFRLVPENKIQRDLISKIKSHIVLHESYEKELIEIENIDQIKGIKTNFLTAENNKA